MKLIGVIILVVIITLVLLYRRELILASPVNGVVIVNGEPAALAEINQEIFFSWKDKILKAETKSDTAGNFSLPAITYHDVLAQLLPHQPNVKQTISISYNGVQYPAWFFNKSDYLFLTELEGESINLVCELSNEKDYLLKSPTGESIDSPYGICRITPKPEL